MSGLNSAKNGCQSIISDIARDIMHQRDHLVQRQADVWQAGRLSEGLANKRNCMVEQLEQYRQYITHCLANLHRADNNAGINKRVHFSLASHRPH